MKKELTKRDDFPFSDPLDIFDRKGLGIISRRGGWAYAFPRVDISENDKEIRVVADIPGVNPDNVDIEVRENWMKISGKVERESESGDDEQPYRYERYMGEFRREFALPVSVKEDQVNAEYKEGVLTITMPKAEEQKRSRIAIKRL
jgi:HSP20 family protein